jgi:tetratricopeptide (TPR) repeat protein
MAETDNVLDEILNHGPSADSISIVLTKMKKEGRFSKVVQECIKFLKVYPDNIRLRLLLAESCLKIGFIGLAESELEKVTSMIEDLTPSYRLLAGIYAKQRRVEEAADTLKLYLAHYPGEPEALKLLEEMRPAPVSVEAPLDAEELLDEVVPGVEEPSDALVDFATPTIAELYYEQGKLSTAISTYEKVISSNPDDSESLKRLIELKGTAPDEPGPEGKEKDDLHARTEKLITILEEWLPKIKEIQHA